jgi:2-keto-4-pentenoate hydratase
LAGGAKISAATNRMRAVEPEFAFRIGQPVPVRPKSYSIDEVLARVSDLHLTLELPDSRFAEFATVGGPSLIADNACARELVVGPAVAANWRALDLAAHEVHVIGANVLGDPRA